MSVDSMPFILGGLLIVISLLGLGESELRANRKASDLRAIESRVVEGDASRLNPALDGRIVHMTGMLKGDTGVTDPDTGVYAESLLLHRDVIMFQYVNDSQTSFYSTHHKKVWSGSHIPAGPSFTNPKSPTNPPFPFQTADFDAPNIHLGDFHLDETLLGKRIITRPTPIGARAMTPGGNVMYIGPDPSNWQVGDMIVTYTDVPAQVVSLIALQAGNQLVAMHMKHTAEDYAIMAPGAQSVEGLLHPMRQHEHNRKWTVRLAVLAALAIGLRAWLVSVDKDKGRVWTIASANAAGILALELALFGAVDEPPRALPVLLGVVLAVVMVFMTDLVEHGKAVAFTHLRALAGFGPRHEIDY
jgi:hypothetical protein